MRLRFAADFSRGGGGEQVTLEHLVKITMNVNGEARTVEASPWKRLLDVLREDVRLTGTKEGCGEGECGACSVMLDGEVVNSCLVAAGQADGRKVTTVEGLARGEMLHAVQKQL